MSRLYRVLIAGAVIVALSPAPAGAFLQFNRQFLDLYIKDHKNEDYIKFVKLKAKCWVCHQGRLKKNHNPYGIHLVELLGEEDKTDTKKIVAALKKVGAMHSDPKDKESPTYEELIAAGKLPGGKLEDLKKEPKQE